RSRLRALTATMDTRGWAIKNANINISLPTDGIAASDRLVAPMAAPSATVDDTDIRASDDILDEQNNADARRLQSMIDQKTKARREQLIANLKSGIAAAGRPAANNYWFLNQPSTAAKIPSNMVTFNTQVVTPGSA